MNQNQLSQIIRDHVTQYPELKYDWNNGHFETGEGEEGCCPGALIAHHFGSLSYITGKVRYLPVPGPLVTAIQALDPTEDRAERYGVAHAVSNFALLINATSFSQVADALERIGL